MQSILEARSANLPNGMTWTPRYRTTCQSIEAVYIMKCCCGALYIGKTKRPLFCRIRDHVSLIAKQKWKLLSVGMWDYITTLTWTQLAFLAWNTSPVMNRGGVISIRNFCNSKPGGFTCCKWFAIQALMKALVINHFYSCPCEWMDSWSVGCLCPVHVPHCSPVVLVASKRDCWCPILVPSI